MIAAGHVYKLHVNFIRPPKPKYLVLAYIMADGRARFFAINSVRTAFQISNEIVTTHLLLLPRGSLELLTHDSWLDCSELLSGWTADGLETIIEQNPACYCEKLSLSVRDQIKAIAAGSTLLTERDKKLILGQMIGTPPGN